MKKQSFVNSIEGKRIFLKKHDINLAGVMFSYIEKDRERLQRFLPWVPFVKTVEDEVKYIKDTHRFWEDNARFDFGIFRKDDDVYMGNIGVHGIHWDNCCCEAGYWILGDFEGAGYVSEALKILENYIFSIGFNRLEVRCSSANDRSAKVPISGGYVFEGVLLENVLEHQKFRDTLIFAKLKRDYVSDH